MGAPQHVAGAHDLSTKQPGRFHQILTDLDKYIKDNGLVLALGHGIGNPGAVVKKVGGGEK